MRRRVLAAATAYLGAHYQNGAGMGPRAFDCSGLIERAVTDAFPDTPLGALCPGEHFTTARGMWNLLAEVDQPQPGDLAIYTSPHTSGDDEYHVMFVDGDGVVGACPTLNAVGSARTHDYALGRWRLKGYRRLPLEKLRP